MLTGLDSNNRPGGAVIAFRDQNLSLRIAVEQRFQCEQEGDAEIRITGGSERHIADETPIIFANPKTA